MTVVEVVALGWASGPLAVAAGRRERRIGLRPRPTTHGLFLRTRSIHTFGMRCRIGVIAVDAEGIVIAAKPVPPRRVWTVWRASGMLEVPIERGLPDVGEHVEVFRRSE